MNEIVIRMILGGLCLLLYAIAKKKVMVAVLAVLLIVVGGVQLDENEFQRKYILKKPLLTPALIGHTTTPKPISGRNSDENVNSAQNNIQPAVSTRTYDDFLNSDFVKNMPYGGYPDWMFYDILMGESSNTAPRNDSYKDYRRIKAIEHYNDLVNTKNGLEPTSVLHSSYTEMIINQRELINSLGGW